MQNTPATPAAPRPLLDEATAGDLASRVAKKLSLGQAYDPALASTLRTVSRSQAIGQLAGFLLVPDNTLVLPEQSCRYHHVVIYALYDGASRHHCAIRKRPDGGSRAQELIDALLRDEAGARALPEADATQPASRYGVLAEVATFDYNNPQETLYIKREPHLIIGTDEAAPLAQWRQRHTIHERQQGILGLLHPISASTYEKGVGLRR